MTDEETQTARADTDADTDADTGAHDGERAVARLAAAVAALDDAAIRTGVAALSEQSRGELADQLHLPRATMHLGNALPPLLRRKLAAAGPERQLAAAMLLGEAPNDDTVRALGSRHDDPSRDDLLEVLPRVVAEYGTSLVVLMMAAYAASDAPCQAVMAELVDTDTQFAIGDAIPDDGAPTPLQGTGAPIDTKEQAAKREERKAQKAARREAAAHERAAKQAAHAARKAAQRRAKHS